LDQQKLNTPIDDLVEEKVKKCAQTIIFKGLFITLH
jgi:hypothetical protein